MVHNLRARNICGTSDKVVSRITRQLQKNLANETTPLSSMPTINEPSQLESSELLVIRGVDENSNHSGVQLNPLLTFPHFQNINNSSTPISMNFLSSVGVSNIMDCAQAPLPSSTFRLSHNALKGQTPVFEVSFDDDDDEISMQTNDITTKHTHKNTSSLRQNLQAAVDTVIFKKTYSTAKGVSLRAIKAEIQQDFGYKLPKTRKRSIVCEYVRDGLSTGKLRQITGTGARGTFRLNKQNHTRFINAIKQGKVEKIRNVSSTQVCLKRFQHYDMSLDSIINPKKRTI